MKDFSKNKFCSVNTKYKNLPCLDKIKTKKAFFDLSHVKALITRARICKRLLVPIFGLALKYNQNARFLAKLFEKKVLAKNQAL